ncbi:hypothetical protein GCM10008939_11100 [Deinococcus aquiradiocola]|uniref:Uncharacterized protein n=1 Tax=Deinococcus aquiradiocola TaxID=393059 RepID=A0A917UMA2_9DEIO|nr:hypothetical protein GCM10008939_11100 [Deinococcus aquiradiocola]
MAAASPFLRTLPLEWHGLTGVQLTVHLAHALGDDSVLLYRDHGRTSATPCRDGPRYRALTAPLLERFDLAAHPVNWPFRRGGAQALADTARALPFIRR